MSRRHAIHKTLVFHGFYSAMCARLGIRFFALEGQGILKYFSSTAKLIIARSWNIKCKCSLGLLGQESNQFHKIRLFFTPPCNYPGHGRFFSTFGSRKRKATKYCFAPCVVTPGRLPNRKSQKLFVFGGGSRKQEVAQDFPFSQLLPQSPGHGHGK